MTDDDNQHPVPPPQQDQRVSEVIGERVCTNCGFNLFAQPILREHHYNMLIVRCPECGTVAALQEYPLLGKWANRWSRLLAAAWLLAIVIGLIITGGIISGMANEVAYESATPYAISIGKYFQPYRLQHPELYGKDTVYSNWYNEGEPYNLDSNFANAYIDGNWWQDIGMDTFLQNTAYHDAHYDWSAVFQVHTFYLLLIIFGIFWSVILVGASRRYLFITLITIGVIAWAIIFIFNEWPNSSPYGWGVNVQVAQNLATVLVGPQIRPLVISMLLIPTGLGMIFGRTIVRFLIIALYPPRMRGWLAFLWIADGKAPPQRTWLDR